MLMSSNGLFNYSNDGNTALNTGFFRDASDEQYYLFNGLEDANLDANNSVTTIDRSGTGFTLADLNVSRLIATTESTRDILKLDAGSNTDGWLEINADTTVGRIRAFSSAYATSFLQNSVSLETADDLSLIAYSADSNIKFHTGGFPGGGGASFERMRIDSAGDISIGSASNHSGARIVINDTPPTAFGSPMLQVGQETFTASGYYSIGLGYTAGSYTEPPAEIAAVSTSSSGGTTADIIFGTRSVTTNTAVTERMRIKSDGTVGIGVNNPTGATLEIQSNAGANALKVRARTNDDYSFIQFYDNAGTTLRGQIANHNGDFNFYTGSSGTIRAKLNTSGHLAIGNTNATYILDVDAGAPASSDQVLGRFSSQNGVRDIGFVWDDSASTLGIATLTNHALTFHTNGNSSERMRIASNGIVSGLWADNTTHNASGKFVKMTQAQYNAITPDSNTIYFIT